MLGVPPSSSAKSKEAVFLSDRISIQRERTICFSYSYFYPQLDSNIGVHAAITMRTSTTRSSGQMIIDLVAHTSGKWKKMQHEVTAGANVKNIWIELDASIPRIDNEYAFIAFDDLSVKFGKCPQLVKNFK